MQRPFRRDKAAPLVLHRRRRLCHIGALLGSTEFRYPLEGTVDVNLRRRIGNRTPITQPNQIYLDVAPFRRDLDRRARATQVSDLAEAMPEAFAGVLPPTGNFSHLR